MKQNKKYNQTIKDLIKLNMDVGDFLPQSIIKAVSLVG